MSQLSRFLIRTLSQIYRGGVPVLVRKIRKLPRRVATSRLIVTFSLWWKFSVVLIGVGRSHHRFIFVKDKFNDALCHIAEGLESASFNVALNARDLISSGEVVKAHSILESNYVASDCHPEVLHSFAQTHYLLGNWRESMKIRREVVRYWDNQSEKMDLVKLGVRFISGSFIGHIGHHGFVDAIIKAEKLGILTPEQRIIVGRKDAYANSRFIQYLSNFFEVRDLDLVEFRGFASTMRPLFEDVSLMRLNRGLTDIYAAYSLINDQWMQQTRPPLFSLDEFDLTRGWDVLTRWGLKQSDWFVSLHVREGDGNPWTNNADARIESYSELIDHVVDAGGWVVRMGNPNMTPLQNRGKVIDYALSDDRCDWMDVFLWSQCRAFVGTMSGPFNIPPVFGVPTLITNHSGIGLDQGFGDSLFLPKLYFDRTKSRLLSAAEMLEGPFGWTVSRNFPGRDIVVVENSPDDLAAAVQEILEIASSKSLYRDIRERQSPVLEQLASLGRVGRTPFPESFFNRHSQIFNA